MVTFPNHPYFDDFDEAKGFLQILFNSGRPVQARELTQLQTILKNQVTIFGRHVFRHGSPVVGGEITQKVVKFVKLESSFEGNPIVVDEFLDAVVVEDETGNRAKVVKVFPAEDDDPETIYLSMLEGASVTPGNTLFVEGTTIGANIENDQDAVGDARYLGVEEGYFFIEGNIVFCPNQSIIISKYNNVPSGHGGLLYSVEVVTPDDDESLLDNAQGSNNYAGAGADRFKINLDLHYVHTDNVPPENFVLLISHEAGVNTNIVRHPLYDIIGKEMARRTFDESGNYTVRPFKLNITPAIHLDVISMTRSGSTITVTTAQENTLEVGSPIVVSGVTGVDANIYNGEFTVTSVTNVHTFTYDAGDTPSDHVNLEQDDVRIDRPDHFAVNLSPGKAYVKGFEYESIAPRAISVPRARQTEEVQNYNLTTTFGNYLVVEDVNGWFNTPNEFVTLYDDVNGTGNNLGSAKIRFIRMHSGDIGVDAKWRLYLYDFQFTGSSSISSVRSIESLTGDGICNVAADSIDDGNAFLRGSNLNSLIYRIPRNIVATLEPGGTNNNSFTFHREMVSTATGSNYVLNLSGNETFRGPFNIDFVDTDAHRNFYHFVRTDNGEPVAINSIEITSSGQQLNVSLPASDIEVRALVPVHITQHAARTKTLTQHEITISAGEITSATKTASIGYPDVHRIISIHDSGDVGEPPTTSHLEITDRFRFDNGQRDNFYDHASITLQSGANPPAGQVLVVFEYFAHSGSGYFSVDSYGNIPYEDIPIYTSPSGQEFDLANCVDFRPVRQVGATVHTNSRQNIPATVMSIDFEFYVPRRDIIILRPDGEFQVIQGEPDQHPRFPNRPDFAMKLYELQIPAYTHDHTDVSARFIENKRFTMRDVGRIERRVNRLEYYTSLSLLEMDTKTTPVFDADGLERFKNGFIVDAFQGHNIGNVRSPDYKCSIDKKRGELRPPFISDDVKMILNNSTNIVVEGNANMGLVYTLPYTLVPDFINNTASKSESVNPFLVIKLEGHVYCNPDSDFWIDTERAPDVNVNLSGLMDNWDEMVEGIEGQAEGMGTEWGDWETSWLGDWEVEEEWTETSFTGTEGWDLTRFDREFQSLTQMEEQTRTGTRTTVNVEEVQEGLGERVIDVNVIPFMRELDIAVTVEGLRPHRDLHVFFAGEKMNNNVDPQSGFEPNSEGSVRSDDTGFCQFMLHIPGSEFHTGAKELRIIDDRNNVLENATTFATYQYHSQGLLQTKNEAILSTRIPQIETETFTETRNITHERDRLANTRRTYLDPIAQNFFVIGEDHPQGMFIKKARLFFRNKPEDDVPVEVQIRPTVNGYPHSETIMPFGVVFLDRDQVQIPEVTDDIESIRAAPTEFEFPAPIYLEPDREYSLIVRANSAEYEVYIGVLGQLEFGTDNIIYQNEGLTSLFKSQNARTWTAFQDENLMMEIDRCEFDTEVTGVLEYLTDYNHDIKVNVLNYNAEILEFPVTTVLHERRIRDSASDALSDWIRLERGRNTNFPTEKIITDTNSFQVRTSLSTNHRDVAPMVEDNRNHAVCVHNIVNNLGLLADGFIINDPGSGYTNASVSFSGGGGSGAEAEAVIEGGQITGITLTNPGEGYKSEPTVTISGDGSGADVIYEGVETDSVFGNAKARYMTRPITLTRDWWTDFVKVQSDVNLPPGTNIYVYYKVLAEDDPNIFIDQPWVEMQRETEHSVHTENPNTFREISYLPVGNSIGYDVDGVNYSHIKTLAIKIVMTSNNTSVVPRIKNFRAITTAP